MYSTYPESHQKSAECLRLAVAAMAKQPAPWNPITYAVWYAHASGKFSALSAAIEASMSMHTPITDEAARLLYARHLESAGEAAATKASAGLQTLLDGIEAASQDTDAQVCAVKQSLDHHHAELSQRPPANSSDLQDMVLAIAEDTRRASHTLAAFEVLLESTNAEVALLRNELTQARKEAANDALTGVLNRRGFDDAVQAVLAEQQVGGAGLVLMMLDLDHFKQINDTFGHVFGDRVLKAVAQVVKSSVKGRDLVARYGGEEFVVLLSGISMQAALSLANQIRESVAAARIRRSDDVKVGAVTVSIGLAEHRHGEAVELLVERADRALYRSKHEGRNLVRFER
jgi:diguanylate cyclase